MTETHNAKADILATMTPTGILHVLMAVAILAILPTGNPRASTLDEQKILSIIGKAGYIKRKKTAYSQGTRTSNYRKSIGVQASDLGKTAKRRAETGREKASRPGKGEKPVYQFGSLPPVPPSEIELAERYALAFGDSSTPKTVSSIKRNYQKKARMKFRRGQDSRDEVPSFSGRSAGERILYYY